jgi:hypothetical protein
MKVAAFRAILAAAEGLYRDGGNDAAQALSLLARLLAARDAMTVAAFAALLADAPAADDSSAGQGGPTLVQLTGVLDMLRFFCQAAGAKTAEKDLQTLADALEARAAQPVAAFSAQVQAWLSEAAAKPKGRKAAGKSTAKASAALSKDAINAAISVHLAALRNAGTDRTGFEAALAALKADKAMKAPSVAEIARRYANTVTKYKSAAAARADIESAFTQQARFVNKVG